MKLSNSYIFIFAFILLGGFAISSNVMAANLLFNTSSTNLSANQDFNVDIAVDPAGQNLNAFEGEISFPSSLLSVKQIRDGDSIINFWVEQPHLSSSTDPNLSTIVWSGITPGGFQSVPSLSAINKGNIFSIVFSPLKTGNGQITADDIRFLINDGLGTPAKVSVLPMTFEIGNGTGAAALSIPKDMTPPEEFTPEITNDPSIFDNQHFLVFAADDKESGIDHYEVLETWFGWVSNNAKWTTAESPYLLKDQTLAGYIFVKAFDKSGNYRIETVAPLHPEIRYKYYFLWSIIILSLLIIGSLLWKKLKRK